jgi:hypothetical protein
MPDHKKCTLKKERKKKVHLILIKGLGQTRGEVEGRTELRNNGNLS